MKRILLSAILIAAILIVGTGCMFDIDNETKQNVNELALEYMEQKYGEKFEYSAAASISLVVLVIEDSKYIDCDSSKARDYNIRNNFFAKGEITRVDGNTSIDYYWGE